MNNDSIKLQRREFLAGAATAIVTGAGGILPSIGAAREIGARHIDSGLLLLFWNGFQFVPAANALPAPLGNSAVNVRVDGYGASPGITAIDVQMPGGTFHAFTAGPRGHQTVQFSAPITHASGLTLLVSGGESMTTFELRVDSVLGPKLALGAYLLVDARVQVSQLVLTSSPDAPVVSSDGQPVASPYVLINVSE
jgi:hypothetical protein